MYFALKRTLFLGSFVGTVYQQVDTSVTNAISSGEGSDDFALKCYIEQRSLKSRVSFGYVDPSTFDMAIKHSVDSALVRCPKG